MILQLKDEKHTFLQKEKMLWSSVAEIQEMTVLEHPSVMEQKCASAGNDAETSG